MCAEIVGGAADRNLDPYPHPCVIFSHCWCCSSSFVQQAANGRANESSEKKKKNEAREEREKSARVRGGCVRDAAAERYHDIIHIQFTYGTTADKNTYLVSPSHKLNVPSGHRVQGAYMQYSSFTDQTLI